MNAKFKTQQRKKACNNNMSLLPSHSLSSSSLSLSATCLPADTLHFSCIELTQSDKQRNEWKVFFSLYLVSEWQEGTHFLPLLALPYTHTHTQKRSEIEKSSFKKRQRELYLSLNPSACLIHVLDAHADESEKEKIFIFCVPKREREE
jgi:hypothetical protein